MTNPSRRRQVRWLVVLLAVLIATPLQSVAFSPTATAATPPCRGAAVARSTHVVWVVLENHDFSSIVGSPSAPYLTGLARSCGLASNYHAITHPSLPNYIAMTSGSTHGVLDDGSPAAHPLSGQSIFGQVGSRSLLESMTSNCKLTSSGTYAVKHNPQAYYTANRSQCATRNVPLQSTPDLSASFTLIVPDLCHDMHDCSVATGDTWLKGFIPKLLASPQYQAGNTVIFVTFDENEGTSGNQVATIVIAPSVTAGKVVATSYNHYSLLRTTEELLRIGFLGAAATAVSMRSGFHI